MWLLSRLLWKQQLWWRALHGEMRHRRISVVSALKQLSFFRKSRWNCVIWGSPSAAEASAPVKFHRPVGGALMQCFKAWERTGRWRRGGEEGGRKMLRQARRTSPSTRYGVKQSGDKRCSSDLRRSSFWRGWIQIHKRQNPPLLDVVSVLFHSK